MSLHLNEPPDTGQIVPQLGPDGGISPFQCSSLLKMRTCTVDVQEEVKNNALEF